jgi:GNAT superfamily N-acetyltransferase
MPSNNVIIKTYKRKKTSKSQLHPYLQFITIKAMLDGVEVGRLEAVEANNRLANTLGGVKAVGRLMGATEGLGHLCEMVFGAAPDNVSPYFKHKPKSFTAEFQAITSKLPGWKPSEKRESDFDYRICYVESLLISKDYRNQGIGKRLIAALGKSRKQYRHKGEATIIALKCYPIDGEWRNLPKDGMKSRMLFRDENNRLVKFYKNLGFIPDSQNFWMIHTPNEIHKLTTRRETAQPPGNNEFNGICIFDEFPYYGPAEKPDFEEAH